jgi:hypothetical protein
MNKRQSPARDERIWLIAASFFRPVRDSGHAIFQSPGVKTLGYCFAFGNNQSSALYKSASAASSIGLL